MLAERALDWAWVVLSAVVVYVWRVEATMHRHVTRIELLESEMKHREERDNALSSGIDRIAALLEAHRAESAARLADLRKELHEDMKTLIDLARGPGR